MIKKRDVIMAYPCLEAHDHKRPRQSLTLIAVSWFALRRGPTVLFVVVLLAGPFSGEYKVLLSRRCKRLRQSIAVSPTLQFTLSAVDARFSPSCLCVWKSALFVFAIID